MLNVCVCVVSLSQPSSSDLFYVKCPAVEICYLCLCVLSRYPIPVVEICYILNVCVCCIVIPVQ